jgi:hypothetical protein
VEATQIPEVLLMECRTSIELSDVATNGQLLEYALSARESVDMCNWDKKQIKNLLNYE